MKKRIFALLLAAALCLTLAVPYALAARMGDLNGDDKITPEDARIVLRAAINLEKLTKEQEKLADADGDTKITTNDARSVLRAAIGLEDLPEAEQPFDYDAVPDEAKAESGVYEAAYVVMPGEQLKDGSFNQSTWNSVKRYAYENGMTYKYYVPANGEAASNDDIKAAVDAAVKGGAKVVVVCSFFFEDALRELAPANPEVEFLFVDGYPLEDDGGKPIRNVLAVTFKAQEAGFLAGYAAVAEGLTALGFSGGGGGENPSVNLYGFGFLQGANAAAKELGKTVKMNWSFRYGDTFSPSPELQDMLEAWYIVDGIQAVMSCGGGMIVSALDAAAVTGGKVIGVDDDLSDEYPEAILTSACKNMCGATYSALHVYFDGKLTDYPDGEFASGIADNGVMLPETNWSMKTFTQERYAQLLQDVAAGKYVISGDLSKLEDEAFRTNLKVSVI